MKSLVTFICLLVGLGAISALPTLSNIFSYKEGDRFFVTSDENGALHVIDLEEYDIESRFTAETDTIFRLYTRKNLDTPQVLKYQDVQGLTDSNYAANKPTKVITHGWNNNGFDDICQLVKNKFLENFDANVICVDWGAGANGLYTSAVLNVPKVGQFVAKFMDWLISRGSPLGNFHVLGHSLGAHISGWASRSMASGRVDYITGLDPALPLWDASSSRLRPSDGVYVEIIHTNADNLGVEVPIGHNDFYPNGGQNMPGCSITQVGCSHGRAYEYFAYSLGNERFAAVRCATLKDALAGRCDAGLGTSYMGGARPKEAKGMFHLLTRPTPPYYL